MSDEQEITCIVCPIGCKIRVRVDGKRFQVVEGSKCKRGVDYARHEALDPRRVLTTSMLVEDGEWPLVSVRSSQPIPKEKLFDVLQEIKTTIVKAPIKRGQVIIQNVGKTSSNMVATKTVNKK